MPARSCNYDNNILININTGNFYIYNPTGTRDTVPVPLSLPNPGRGGMETAPYDILHRPGRVAVGSHPYETIIPMLLHIIIHIRTTLCRGLFGMRGY